MIPSLGAMSVDVRVLNEPLLVFGDFQRTVDPRIGLGMYGPFDLNDRGRGRAIRLGVIGEGHCIELFRQWVERCRGRIAPIRRSWQKKEIVAIPMDPTVYPFFPGVEQAFDVEVVLDDGLQQTIGPREVEELRRIEFFEPRVTRLVELVIERLRVLAEKPTAPDVVAIALSTEIRDMCTVPSRHKRRGKRFPSQVDVARAAIQKDEEAKQINLFSASETFGVSTEALERAEAEEDEHGIFHHGLKARAMEAGIPTQLIWQGTLEGINVQDDATRAWNLWTGIYYKAGNQPWRSASVTRGTCFVGVAFYVDRSDRSYRSAMAQAFSDLGEGFVMRGQPFKWSSLQSPHLTTEHAEDLMRLVLTEYERHLQHRPNRIVVHKWSRFWDEERAGFDKALAGIPQTDYVALGNRDIRFFRTGEHPPMRGTMITLGRGNALLYTKGFIPFLGTHVGPRVPRPIEITEHFGGAPLTQICQEILALTKLDWNTADFGGKEPITTAFSEDVGSILAELPRDGQLRTLYRFYM
ncbi:MAG: argonaute/piwi family protein [Gemmatimonadaceae bacterium]